MLLLLLLLLMMMMMMMMMLLLGYQRELTYQRSDGSFSAFGDRDPSGSIWSDHVTFNIYSSFHQTSTGS